jgi:hypothetical protein
MLDFTTAIPLPRAVEVISNKTPLGSRLGSAEWALVSAEIRQRAMFSARVEEERYLISMQDKLQQRILLGRNEGTLMDRSRFIAEMQDDLRQFGYEPDPRKRGSLQDLSSAGRLGLIYDMNLAQAEGYAGWKTGMDADILDAAPARELVRLANRIDKRPWPAIWREHGGQFYGEPSPDFPEAEGRMIALATDKIWKAISEFGSPWPPFRWGSGVGTRNVRRRIAEEFGLLKPGERITPLKQPFNSNAEASLKGIPEKNRQAIQNDLLGEVDIEGDVLRLLPAEPYGSPQKKPLPKPIVNTADQPAPKGSVPVTDLIKIAKLAQLASPKVAGKIKSALEAVAQVHTLPDLGKIKIRIDQELSDVLSGQFVSKAKESFLLISPNSLNVEMATWNALARMMDRIALQGDGKRKFASQGQPSLREVMSEIQRSTAYLNLKARADADQDTGWISQPDMFARAYAQFIATETRNPAALEFIRKVRTRGYEADGVWKDTQWTAIDFRLIQKAFRALLNTGKS